MAKAFSISSEIDLHYKDSIVLYKDKKNNKYIPIFIVGTEHLSKLSCKIRILKCNVKDNSWEYYNSSIRYTINKKNSYYDHNIIDWRYPYNRCINIKDKALVSYRIPKRQWTWGLSFRNTVIKDPLSNIKIMSNISGAVSETIPVIKELFFPTYFFLEPSINILENNEASSVALSSELIISKNMFGSKKFLINYKTKTIGYVNSNLELVIPNKLNFLKPKLKTTFKDIKMI